MGTIPTHIITGFLGSGKTTFLKRLLLEKKQAERWAIVINEFGSVSIDSKTIRKESSTTGEVYEIPGGCICCSAKGTLKHNLDGIASSGEFDRIVIEPSGLGGLDMIEEIVGEIDELVLMPSVCMVDITTAQNARIKINMLFRSQILHSNYIFFTKTDLLNIKQIEKNKTYFRINFGISSDLEWQGASKLFQSSLPETKQQPKSSSLKTFFLAGLNQSSYESIVIKCGASLLTDSQKLNNLLTRHPAIVRAKGNIKTPAGWVLFNFTISGYTSVLTNSQEQNELVVILEKERLLDTEEIHKAIKGLFK